MAETNVNTSGQGTTNWNLPAGTQPTLEPQPKLDPATGKPFLPGQIGTQKGTGEEDATDVEARVQTAATEEVIQDTVTTTPQTDATRYTLGTSTNGTSYTAPSNNPSLPPSTVNDPQVAADALNATIIPSKDAFNNTVGNVVNLIASNADTDLTPEEAQAVVTDPQILKLAEQSGVSPQVLFKNVQTEKNHAFQELVNKLPPDQAKALTFAQYVPEGAKNLSPADQAMLQQINAKVNQEVAANFKFSSDWPGVPTNSTEFRAILDADVDFHFSKALNAKVDDGSLSASDAAMIRAMNNGMATGTPTMKNILQQIQSQVTAQLQAKYGFDVSYQPKGDVTAYNNIVNGDFAQTYQKLVAKYTGTATAEQKVLLAQYAANPRDPSIPDSIKQLAQQIADEQQLLLQAFPDPDKASMPDSLKGTAKALIAEGVDAIVGKYGLDPSWKPTINSLVSPYVDPAALKSATNAMDTAQEILSLVEAKVSAMPDGPERTQYLQYLRVISAALTHIQETIYQMQAAQSKASTAYNNAQLEAHMNDIAKQRDAIQETRRQEKKKAKWGPFLNVMNWIMKIAIIAVGSLLFPLALLYVVDSSIAESKGQNSKLQDMFAEVVKATSPKVTPEQQKLLDKYAADPNDPTIPDDIKALAETIKGGAWLATIVNGAISTVLSLATCNPLIAVNLFTQDAKFMQTMIKGCGGNEEQQTIGAMVFSVVVQVALSACLFFAGPGMVGQLVATTAAQIAQVAQVSIETATTIVKACYIATQITITSMQITASGVKLNNALIQMQLDRLKGNTEAYTEEVQAMIACLKKLVQKLLELLEGAGDTLVNISNLQGKKWNDSSETTSMIFG